MNLLFFAGSLRVDSINKKLVREAMNIARQAGAEVEFIDLKDYPIPLYDGDLEASAGIPEMVAKLGAKIRAANGLVIATPEYNGGISGVLKNVIDWLSREKDMSLGGKHLMLISASPGALGGVRGLWHARVPFEVLGVHVYPSMVGVPSAFDAFDAEGKLKDAKYSEMLKTSVTKFIEHTKSHVA